MPTTLGYKPIKGTLLLSDGADWVCTLTTGDVWPEGTTVWCEVGDLPQWDAVVDEPTGTAAFVVQSDVTDPVESGEPFTIYLRYPSSPTAEYAWFEGKVKRTTRQ